MKDKASEIEKSIEICVNMDAKDIIDAENSKRCPKNINRLGQGASLEGEREP
jgi:hypothetical protein